MRQLLLAVLVAGSLASDADLVQLEAENLRLKELLEQETNTLDSILDKAAAFHSCSGGTCSEPPKPPPKPVSPKSPRRRLSHTAGQNICAAAATPDFPFAANSGWLTPPAVAERVSSNVTVSAGSDAPGVSWSLNCDGLDHPITGGAGSTTMHEIPTGACTLSMEALVVRVTVSPGSFPSEVSWSLACDGLDDPITGGANYLDAPGIPAGACNLSMTDSYGDGWDGAEWSAPGLGPFSIEDGSSGVAHFTVGPGSFTAHGDGWNGAQWSAPGWRMGPLGTKTGPFSLSSGGSGSESFTVMPAAGAFQYMTGATDPSSTGADAGPGGSGSYFKTEASREITVSAGSYPSEVSWSLACDGLHYPMTGGANYDSTTELPVGACSLSMTDSYGDGWNGAEWSAPGLGPFSIEDGYSGVAHFTVRPASFALGFDGAEQCNGAAVATVSFQYHMFETGTGTLSLKTAEGATLWTKSGQQSSGADDTGWTQSETVPVNSASFHFEYVVPPPQESIVVMVYTDGTTAQDVQTGTATVVPGATYTIKTEILRNDLGSADERVTSILVDGVELGGCNPDGGDYDCTFFDCSSTAETHTITPTSNELHFELHYVGHSWDCDCDTTTWESGDTSCSSELDAVSGRSAMTAVARFTLTRQLLLPTAAVAQMQVCCAPPMSSTTTTFVHHSVPHSFADAAACLHTEGPPLTIRESATSTVSATQTPPRDSNHLVC